MKFTKLSLLGAVSAVAGGWATAAGPPEGQELRNLLVSRVPLT